MKRCTLIRVSILLASICGVLVMPAHGNQENQLEERINALLMVEDDETGQYWEELVGYGERALPVFEEILSTPQNDELGELRVTRVLSAIHRGFSDVASPLRPHIEAKLSVESRMIRRQAVPALAAISEAEDVPIFVAMLYDPDSMVRHQAVIALGKLGNVSALVALDIWEQQASAADESRPPTEKWIDSAMPSRLKHVRDTIRERINGTRK